MELIIYILFLLTSSSPDWVTEEVDSIDIMEDCSIAIDREARPHLAYCGRLWREGNISIWGVKYARWNGTIWEFQMVDTMRDTSGWPVFKTSKICLDNHNYPHIAYCKGYARIKYAYYNGNSWQLSTIDSFDIDPNYMRHRLVSMALSEDGSPHICYSFINFNDSIPGIRYAYRSGDSWVITTIWRDTLPSRFLSTSAIDMDDLGYPAIASNDWYPPVLFCARFDGQNWNLDTIQTSEESYFIYSMKIDRDNRINLTYLWNFWTWYARESGDTWNIELVGGCGYGYAAGDLEMDGNKPSLVYSSTSDPVTYFYKIDTIWYAEVIEPNYTGLFPSLAKDSNGNMHIAYTRLRGIYYYLCYAQRNPSVINEKEMRQISTPEPLPKIYPNPASSVVCVRFNPPSPPFNKGGNKRGDLEIRIYDVCGKLVQEILRSVPNEKEVISLKGIKSGVYFLKIKTEKGEVEKRLVILR